VASLFGSEEHAVDYRESLGQIAFADDKESLAQFLMELSKRR